MDRPIRLEANHKLIITGTGRAGTTFLVRLLTALGLPTGYTEETWQQDYYPHCSAGLEKKITDPDAPYIVKDPGLCVTLRDVLTEGTIVVDHAIVPVRDLDSAAKSRMRVGGVDGNVPGGLVGTADPATQRTVLAERFHELMLTLAEHRIPHTLLVFPRFAEDAAYTFAQLSPIFPDIDRAEFMAAFARTSNRQLVHDFSKASGATSVSGASGVFQEREQEKRRWRRLRRITGWTSVAVCLLVASGIGWSATAPDDETDVPESAAPTVGRPSFGVWQPHHPRVWRRRGN